MNKKNEIDKLFEQKLNSLENEFNLSSWDKMEELLDSRKSKRRRYIYYGVVSLFTIVAGFILVVKYSYQEKLTTENQETGKTNLWEEKQVINEITPKSDLVSDNLKKNVVEVDVQSKIITEKKSVEKNKLNAIENKQVAISIEKNQNKNSETKKTETDLLFNVNNKVENSLPEQKTQNNNYIDLSSKENMQLQNNKTETTAEEKGNAQSSVKEIITNDNSENSLTNTGSENKTDNKVQLLNDDNNEQTNMNETDSEAEKIPLKDRLNWLRRYSAGAIIGGNISQGFYGTENKKLKFGTGVIAGMRLAYQLNETVTIDVNALYHTRNAINTTLFSETLSQGILSTRKEIMLTLHYIDIPFYLHYRFSKHEITAGLQYSYLTGVTKQDLLEKTNSSGEIISESKTKNYESNTAFNKFDLAANIGYEYNLNEKINIGTRINYGLYDITDDQVLKKDKIDKNFQLRIFMEYKIFKY